MKAAFLCVSVACALTVIPYVSQAAPIQLQVTVVNEGNTNCNSYVVSGTNFNFAADITGYCSGPGIYGMPGGTLQSSVTIFAPTYPVNALGYGQTLGSINVPENPGRVAFFTGSFTASGPSVTIPSPAPSGTFQLQTIVTLQGTLNACLLPAGAVGGGPCDPNYANFATVNFNLTGTDVFQGDCIDPYTCLFSQTFTATASSVPEPASLGMVSVAGLCLLASLNTKRHDRKNALLTQAERIPPGPVN